jgi:hypothetical protein
MAKANLILPKANASEPVADIIVPVEVPVEENALAARAAWKARNARDRWHLEIPAVQLITPNLPDSPNNEAERERGQDFEHRCRY